MREVIDWKRWRVTELKLVSSAWRKGTVHNNLTTPEKDKLKKELMHTVPLMIEEEEER